MDRDAAVPARAPRPASGRDSAAPCPAGAEGRNGFGAGVLRGEGRHGCGAEGTRCVELARSGSRPVSDWPVCPDGRPRRHDDRAVGALRGLWRAPVRRLSVNAAASAIDDDGQGRGFPCRCHPPLRGWVVVVPRRLATCAEGPGRRCPMAATADQIPAADSRAMAAMSLRAIPRSFSSRSDRIASSL